MNDTIIKHVTGNIDFKVIKKETSYEYIQKIITGSMTDWEKKAGVVTTELNKKIEALQKVIINLDDPCDFVYSQIVRIQNSKTSQNILSPLYNPIYTDSLFVKAFTNKYNNVEDI